MELLEGNTAMTSGMTSVYTKLRQITELSSRIKDKPLTTLSHHIDLEFLKEAYALTRKSGATGIDEVTAADYAVNLEENLKGLLEAFKSGRYFAPPVKRAYIPKADGKQRPLGIPTFEDKVLQRTVSMVLEAVYESEFMRYSYAYRKRRSAHHALSDLREGLMDVQGGWVYEVDLKSFFDTIDHGHMREILDKRVQDGTIRRVIGKWLKAGVVENGHWRKSEEGSPQGGVISPLLANIFLHEVLDTWYEQEVKPRMRGKSDLIRYADDFVIWFEREDDARRIAEVVPKRMARFGLTVHPDKTRLIRFERPPKQGPKGGGKPPTFDFLGFTHYWGRSRSGYWVIKRKTEARRISRKLKQVKLVLRRQRHDPIAEQQRWIGSMLKGYYNYYGITGNFEALRQYYEQVCRIWRKWLNRRSQKPSMPRTRFAKLLERYPLPRPRIVHSI